MNKPAALIGGLAAAVGGLLLFRKAKATPIPEEPVPEEPYPELPEIPETGEPTLVSIYIPDTVVGGQNFETVSTWYIQSPYLGVPTVYKIDLELENSYHEHTLGEWVEWRIEPRHGTLMHREALNPETKLHTIKSSVLAGRAWADWSTNKIKKIAPATPGIYQIRALMRMSRLVKPKDVSTEFVSRLSAYYERKIADYEYGSPQQQWDFGIVKEIIVT